MANLYFDIETIPAAEDKYPDLKVIYENKRKKSESYGEEIKETFEQFVASTSLSGAFGQVCCIAYALDDEPVKVLFGDEKNQLQEFWKIVNENKPLIGHNILQFDIPFIIQRSIILGVPFNFIPPKPWEKGVIFDTLIEWKAGGWSKGWNSLDIIARALGLQSSKEEIDGSQVAQAYKDGKVEDICNYCKADVELTRKVYKKLTFN